MALSLSDPIKKPKRTLAFIMGVYTSCTKMSTPFLRSKCHDSPERRIFETVSAMAK